MQTRRVGSSGLQVSEIGLGSWLTLGSRFDDAPAGRLVRRAFDSGINFFDTADVYANGAAETTLGRALRDIPRHHVVLASKCFFPMSAHANDAGLSRKHIVESVEGSLARLGTHYLDLHQCHRPDPAVPIEETVRAYEDLVRQGKLLYWGVSHWQRDQLEVACEIADRTHGYRPISNQNEYSLLARDLERSQLPWCERYGIGQLVFSPLGQGVLSGKYRDGRRPEGSRAKDAERNRWMSAYLAPGVLARVERLRAIAEELSLSLSKLALAWCLRSTAVASVIVGATSAAQLDENCSASGIALPEAALKRIDEIFSAPRNAPG
jgi:aryl-alcohol dehydrogenase-like predicted oxidoreductase